MIKEYLASIRKSYYLRILNYLLSNLLWRPRFHFGWISGGGGDSHANLSPEESIRHIERVFQWYTRYGGSEIFKGTCVEIGPGDSAGVAMLMKHHGVDQAILVDRFRSPREKDHQQKIYGLLADRYNLQYLKKGAVWDDNSIKGVQWHIGQPAELFFQKTVEQGQSFDAIVSCAVMEHLYDPMGCLTNMIKSLKTGGTMVHCIDFRDHGMFEPRYHPLKYLTVPSTLYQLMTSKSGDQNRCLLYLYRNFLEETSKILSFSHDIHIWMLIGGTEFDPFRKIEDIPPKMWNKSLVIVKRHKKELLDEFASMPDKDLAVAGICIVIKKQ